ncbi:AAA family ATPase [Massilia psychrophila]|uniref:AAA+ ATPase domain-containing protein n=1 Tax=Massilia psychrophila TaxID=1603353 RepID=A0A2G8SZF6_9BURK|nr:AAA family ATPase [Massilia psychrophila]PIL39197.1 hypothetical protein CR103_14005 [Massilia psychrophila]GGE82127.1 hypothetical protein GCM10008020_28810 [Massilia psychrophila]
MSFHYSTPDEKKSDLKSGFLLYDSLLLTPFAFAKEIAAKEKLALAMKKVKALIASAGPAVDPHDPDNWEPALDDGGLSKAVSAYPFPLPPSPISEFIQIYEQEAVHHRYSRIESLTGDRDERTKIKERLNTLRHNGEYRRLAKIPTSWRSTLNSLEIDHPNFTPVIEYLRGVFAIAERCDGVPVFGNIIIDGPPGCGKTYFSKKLAQCLGTEFHALHLETMQTAGEIVGDSDSYRSSAPGALYNAMVDGKFANPVVLMDEICKMGGDERFRPQTALYRIFERETAKTFSDCSEPWLTLDLSHVLFLCTSNNYDAVDPAIRSRLKRFTVGMPIDPTQIIRNIFQQLQRERSTAFADVTLAQSAVDVLVTQSPRRIRQLLEDGIGAALYRERTHVIGSDIDVESVRRPMGF